jgi:CubicO group peptidase (beta-lactamase class C family)
VLRRLPGVGRRTTARVWAIRRTGGPLVEDELLGWDDRVVDHLPWFELHDPYVTREITVRDLLSHRSGLGRRGDANWYATDFTREEIVRRIRYLEPETSFRATAG